VWFIGDVWHVFAHGFSLIKLADVKGDYTGSNGEGNIYRNQWHGKGTQTVKLSVHQ
jgi:hypothetical protein